MQKIVLQIEGMTCSACSYGLEKYLKKQKGILDAQVNLVLSIATLYYENLSLSTMLRYVKEAGFTSSGEFTSLQKSENKKEGGSKTKLIGMGILLGIEMFLSMSNLFSSFFLQTSLLFCCCMCFIVYGFSILKSGFKGLIHRMPTMDSLVLCSVFFSFLYSVFGVVQVCLGNMEYRHNFYFDSISMVIYFVQLGRFLENFSKDKTKEAIRELVSVTPSYALKKEKNTFVKITLDEVNEGDILVVRPGEKIAVDGEVILGKSHVDESFLTGESKPVLKEKKSQVLAGSLNYEGALTYKALRVGKSSLISSIVTLVVEATNHKSKTEKMADCLSSYFVFFVFLYAVLVCVIQFFMHFPLEQIFSHFLTIFVVACPCALGLAVPLVVFVASSRCAKKGIFIRDSSVFEEMRKLHTVVFDKTGTLTYGKMQVSKVFNYLSIKDKDLLNLVANIESLSTHPLKNAFLVTKELEVSAFKNYEGMGVSAQVMHHTYYLGNKSMLDWLGIKDCHSKDYKELLSMACSIIYVVEENQVIGLLGVNDCIRRESKEVIDKLKKENVEVVLLTGDHEHVAQVLAKEAGISTVIAGVSPKEKALFVENLEKQKKHVMMVGDGINDSPSLVKASIGVSIGSGTDVANYSSKVVLMNNENTLFSLLELLQISKRAVRIMKENLLWAFFYNFLMFPIASGFIHPFGIQMNPMLASIFMTISSISVVLNALRLNRKKE